MGRSPVCGEHKEDSRKGTLMMEFGRPSHTISCSTRVMKRHWPPSNGLKKFSYYLICSKTILTSALGKQLILHTELIRNIHTTYRLCNGLHVKFLCDMAWFTRPVQRLAALVNIIEGSGIRTESWLWPLAGKLRNAFSFHQPSLASMARTIWSCNHLRALSPPLSL